MNKITLLFLLLICTASLFLSLFRFGSVPQCFNADEAAFGYNAYSILKTGKDEYGSLLPLRLKSFGDYKLPLYTYGSIPFIALFGLTETGTRAPSVTMAFFLPIAVFLLARELFKKDTPALLSALLVSTSLGLHLISRHAHEAYLTVFLITLSSYFFLRFFRLKDLQSAFGFLLSLSLALLSYQSTRLFAVFFFISGVIAAVSSRRSPVSSRATSRGIYERFLGIFFLLLIAFASIDFVYKPARVNNLVFWNTAGFTLRINELRGKGGSRIFYNKLTVGAYVLAERYVSHLSPQFLAMRGDTNNRFGYAGMPPMTLVEYALAIVGLVFLFIKKIKDRWFIAGLLLVSPLTSSLSWLEPSITRLLFFFIPTLILAAFGFYELINSLKKTIWLTFVIILLAFSIECLLLFYSWNFYLNEYTKKTEVTRAWECGYKELGMYIKENYNRFDRFYISRANGQSYIFMLFYLAYPPEKYQPQANLSGPDEYGFGQVEKFDKFVFSFPQKIVGTNEVVIGAPKDFDNKLFNIDKVKKININGVDRFWIYEP